MTYSYSWIQHAPDRFLINPLKATGYVPCSGTRTPYPQKHQQTLGATLPTLWKTTSKLHISGDSGVFRRVNTTIDHILIVSSKAFIYKAPSRQRTSYPQKRQQTLGASLYAHPGKTPVKTASYAGYFSYRGLQGMMRRGCRQPRTGYPQAHQQRLWVNICRSELDREEPESAALKSDTLRYR